MIIKIKLTSSFIIEKLRVAGGCNVDLVVVAAAAVFRRLFLLQVLLIDVSLGV